MLRDEGVKRIILWFKAGTTDMNCPRKDRQYYELRVAMLKNEAIAIFCRANRKHAMSDRVEIVGCEFTSVYRRFSSPHRMSDESSSSSSTE